MIRHALCWLRGPGPGIRDVAIAICGFLYCAAAVADARAQPATPKAQPFVLAAAGHGSMMVFEHGGRLWRQEGDGAAERLTDADTDESGPMLSPDGAFAAYVGQSGANREVFVASLGDRETQRLTFDGGLDAKVQGWLGPKEVLYSTTTNSGKRGPLLFAVDIRTHRSRAIPLAEASEGCVIRDQFVYVKNQQLVDSNRLYAGGYAQKIYRIRSDLVLGDRPAEDRPASVPLTGSYAGISRNPLCVGDRIIFLSDRSGRFNIWAMNPDGGDLVQLTFEADYDIRGMTTSDGRRIYYQRAGDSFRLDPATGASERVVLKLPDPGARMERFAFDPRDAADFVVSDNGSRVGLVIHGKLWVVTVATGAATCVECHSDRRVKSPWLSPDGATLFALHDGSGEYRLHAYDLNTGIVRNVGGELHDPILDMSVSPDGRGLLVRSIPGRLYYVDARSGASNRIDVGSGARPDGITWSRDSRLAAFVAYSENGIGRVAILDTACSQVTYVTSGREAVSAPAFSDDSHEIYFLTETNFRSNTDDTWGPTNYWPAFDKKSLVHAVDVSSLTAGAPLRDAPLRCPRRVSERGVSRNDLLLIRELPFVAGDYERLSVNGGRLHALAKRAPRDKWGQFVAFRRDLFGSRSAPDVVFNAQVYGYAFSATGKAVVMRTTTGLFTSTIGSQGDFGVPVPLRNVAGLEVEIDLAQEREQIFNEVWRLHRDYFWEPGMAGVDWGHEREKYRGLLPRVSAQAEFGEVVAGMVSELGAGHTSIGFAPLNAQGQQGVARLGAEYTEKDGLRVSRIFDGDLDVMEERSPLSKASAPVNVGDRIVRVNGIEVASRWELEQALHGRVGELTVLGLKTASARVVETQVVPISAVHETWLRNRAWAADNAARVDKASGGAVGYLHLQSAFEADFAGFIRRYGFYHRRQSLIIDLRGNNGGNIDPWILHFLQRRTWLQVADRNDPIALNYPRNSFGGQLIVLIDGDTYSDGELIAEGVRQLKLGVLVGGRTSGAGKWVNDEKTLIDGSRIRIPEAGPYLVGGGERHWIIEGRGVEPDIAVENDPYLAYAGHDAQLEAALTLATKPVGK